MPRSHRLTELIDRFPINQGDIRQCQEAFIQNNGNTFTVSTGTEGIEFSLSDTDLLELLTNRTKRRIVLRLQHNETQFPSKGKSVKKRP